MPMFEFCRAVVRPCATSLATMIAVTAWGAPPSERQRARPRAEESLDEQLLEDLGATPSRPPIGRGQAEQERRSPSESKRAQDSGKPASQPGMRSLDDELLDGLEGEDVSLSPNSTEENPLVRLNQRMKQVERRIAEARSDEKTQRLQSEISDDLSKLIAALDRQCRQCKKQSSASTRPPVSQPKPGKSSAQPASDAPAQDSSDRVQDKETAKVDRAKVQEMLKDVWGHLPPHLRQQMEQSANEEFLPKYELEIAEYYRSLLSGRRDKK
ncbi:MAG TPA: hypothetical protein VG125_33750 [Pirellulales bacterium]|nr:hypothetical protein [Pirellulales bacterium]